MRLAEQVGVADLAEQTVKLSPDVGSAGANPGVKVSSIVAGMACGADSFEDLGVIRHGGMSRLFDGIRAPSTLGTFLVRHEALLFFSDGGERPSISSPS
ncbi:hypothetical protein [Saccharopolyspora hattusasensis]|uniref:hypothetical protein n=1 Tax=Saccharopolyspora hattusasensis TaxID=1128679 RepID=UPI003D9937C2